MSGRARLAGYLALALLAAGIIGRASALVALAIPLALYLGWGMLRRPGPLRLAVKRTISQGVASQRAPVEVKLSIHNEGEDLEELLVEDFLPGRLEVVAGQPALLTPLKAGETVELAYTVRGQRGSYTFPLVRATARDTLGLFRRQEALPAQGRLMVLPEVIRLRQLAIRPSRTHGFAGPIPARVGGSGTDFYSLREYQPGDPRRRINWRVSARHNQALFTNEFEQERIADVGIILDARQQSNLETAEGSIFEYSVQAAASLAEAFLSQGNRVSLLVYGFGIQRTYPGYGKVQLERILHTLAEATTGRHFALEKLDYLPTKFFPAHSQIVMVSPLQTGDLPVLARLRALGYHVLVVSPDPVSYEARGLPHNQSAELGVRLAQLERTVLIRELVRMGVPTVNWQVDLPFNQVADQALRRAPRWSQQMEALR